MSSRAWFGLIRAWGLGQLESETTDDDGGVARQPHRSVNLRHPSKRLDIRRCPVSMQYQCLYIVFADLLCLTSLSLIFAILVSPYSLTSFIYSLLDRFSFLHQAELPVLSS